MSDKTHYRKAFDSPYLSSADIVEPTTLTIVRVTLEKDKTKKTQDAFNTAYFTEAELRPGEKLKPMILNATNSKTLRYLADSPYIDDWRDVKVTIYVDNNIRFGRETVEGLRISPVAPTAKPELTPNMGKRWESAVQAYRRDGSLEKVLARVVMSQDHIDALIEEAASASSD
jgi:hypothetical protein